MKNTITSNMTAMIALLALSFALVVPAYAYDELEVDIEIYSSTTEVEVEYEVDDEEVEKKYTFDTTDIDEVYTLLADELDLSVEEIKAVAKVEDEDEEEEEDDKKDAEEAIEDAEEAIAAAESYLEDADSASEDDEDKIAEAKDYLEEAQVALTAEDYETAEDKAEMAEELAEKVYKADDDDEDEDDDEKTWNKEKCESNPGIGYGVQKKCDDDYKKSDKVMTKDQDKFKDYGKSTDQAELRAQLQDLMNLLIQLLSLQLAQQTS